MRDICVYEVNVAKPGGLEQKIPNPASKDCATNPGETVIFLSDQATGNFKLSWKGASESLWNSASSSNTKIVLPGPPPKSYENGLILTSGQHQRFTDSYKLKVNSAGTTFNGDLHVDAFCATCANANQSNYLEGRVIIQKPANTWLDVLFQLDANALLVGASIGFVFAIAGALIARRFFRTSQNERQIRPG